MMYELPPLSQGTPEQQIADLRNYLVRLARDLDRVGNGEVTISEAVKSASEQAKAQSAQAMQQQASSLKALIIKNADKIRAEEEARYDELKSTYVAISDYGNYYEDIEQKVEQTARGTVESYRYTERIDALDDYMTEINGQIRRGMIEDPDTHEIHLGIAISESLEFTGQTHDEDGITYYVLSPGQTLGLYTSTGWQFWINGQKMGWFSSEDSMLHVANITVENELQVGANWVISAATGFGLRYTGA